MNTLTHALAPVILTRLCAGKAESIGRRGLIFIGIAGALPDLLNPHLSLEARTTSWSHGLPFWLGLSSVLIIGAWCSRGKFTLRLALACSAAYLFHLICDSISGGVNWLYPFRNRIIGDYYVDPIFWVPLDIICLLICYGMFRILPGLRKKRLAKAATAP